VCGGLGEFFGIGAGWFRLARKEAPLEYVPFSADLVGQKPVNVVLGKNSGPPSMEEWCEKLGITATDDQRMAMLLKVKAKSFEKMSKEALERTREFYRQRFFLDVRTEWGLHWRARLVSFVKWPWLVLAAFDPIRGRYGAYTTTTKSTSAPTGDQRGRRAWQPGARHRHRLGRRRHTRAVAVPPTPRRRVRAGHHVRRRGRVGRDAIPSRLVRRTAAPLG